MYRKSWEIKRHRQAKMNFYYSGTESLWWGNWNILVCRKWKCEVHHHSQSKQNLNALFQVFVFGPIWKTILPPGLWLAETFSTSSETAERILSNLDMKQDLNVPYQVCVFRTDSQNKIANIFDWFSKITEQTSTKFNETWQEAISQSFLPSSCFRDDWKRRWQRSLWLNSPLTPLKGIQQNLTITQITAFLTKLVFGGRWVNKNDGKLYSDARYVSLVSYLRIILSSRTLDRFFKKCYMKDDVNVPPRRRQGPDPRPIWLLVGTPLVLRPELAFRRAEHSHSGGCLYIFLIYCFYRLTCLWNNFYGLSALVGCWSSAF